jgi:hypothetical protein
MLTGTCLADCDWCQIGMFFDIKSVHPSAFPQFILPSSIDTIISSISPQFYLPRSMDVETDMQYPDYFPGTVDTMISLNFPQFTPYAATHCMHQPNHVEINVSIAPVYGPNLCAWMGQLGDAVSVRTCSPLMQPPIPQQTKMMIMAMFEQTQRLPIVPSKHRDLQCMARISVLGWDNWETLCLFEHCHYHHFGLLWKIHARLGV